MKDQELSVKLDELRGKLLETAGTMCDAAALHAGSGEHASVMLREARKTFSELTFECRPIDRESDVKILTQALDMAVQVASPLVDASADERGKRAWYHVQRVAAAAKEGELDAAIDEEDEQ